MQIELDNRISSPDMRVGLKNGGRVRRDEGRLYVAFDPQEMRDILVTDQEEINRRIAEYKEANIKAHNVTTVRRISRMIWSVGQFEVSGHTTFKGSDMLSDRCPKGANAVRRKGKMDEVEKQSGDAK